MQKIKQPDVHSPFMCMGGECQEKGPTRVKTTGKKPKATADQHKRLLFVFATKDEPLRCRDCRTELNSGWQMTGDGKPWTVCEPCGVKAGVLSVWNATSWPDNRGRHPWCANPEVKPRTARFALRDLAGRGYVSASSDHTLTPDVEQARLFSAAYLNATNWEWHTHVELVGDSEIKKLIAERKKAEAKAQTTKKGNK